MNPLSKSYRPADFCFLRIPSYPIELFNKIFSTGKLNLENFDSLLKEIFSDQLLRDVVHSSTSGEFYTEFEKWADGKRDQKVNSKMHETLLKYLIRMSTRCIPFGMFTGFSIADAADKTAILIGELNESTQHLRLDMEYLQDIVYILKKDPEIHNTVKFFKNSSIYKIIDKYKYVEYTTDTYRRQYTSTAIGYEPYLEKLLEAATTGISITSAIEVLREYDEEITTEEANDYINELINSQLLVSELEPNITGDDNLTRIVNLLKNNQIGSKYLNVLTEIDRLINDKKYTSDKALRIKELTEKIVGEKPYWSILQTDLELKTIHSTINKRVLDQLLKNLEPLSMFAYGINRPGLEEFKRKFSARYDKQEIPMVEALDSEFGVGYGEVIDSSDLLKNVGFKAAQHETVSVKYDMINEYVNRKYIDCIREGSRVVHITDKELGELRSKGANKTLPSSFFIHGSLIAKTQALIDDGNYLFQLKNISGPPSCLTIGRFCHTSPALTEKVKTCIEREELQQPDAIYAEIVHLTDARVGNVTIRPHLRNYEIQYLGKSGLPAGHLIDITDITVSIKGDEIVLRSKSLNKKVIPRLTNAHVFSDSRLPIYRFLGEVQRGEGNDWLGWHWGNLQNEKFLPRVQYKNLVLKTAKWLLEKEDLPFAEQNSSIKLISKFISEYRVKHGIPRHVMFLEELDKEFVLDLKSEISLSFLIKKVFKDGKVLLEEYLRSVENTWLSDINGNHFVSEMMIPVDLIEPIRSGSTLEKTTHPTLALRRKFPIGSEWIFYKLYTGYQFAEDLLTYVIPDLIKKLREDNLILDWHYIRYSDPDYHIRLRFRTFPSENSYLKVVSLVSAELNDLQDLGYLHKIQIDTYERETERYGSHTIEDSEHVFTIDSDTCLQYIQDSQEYVEEDDRWLFAMKAINQLLDVFKYDLSTKQAIMGRLERYFCESTNADKHTQKHINNKYKLNEKKIAAVLSITPSTGSPLTDAANSNLASRAMALQLYAASVIEKCNTIGETNLDNLISSYIHMFVNRLFKSNPNRSEAVLYTLLNRFYISQLKQKS